MSIIDNLKKSVGIAADDAAPKKRATKKPAAKKASVKNVEAAETTEAPKATAGGNIYSVRLLRAPHVSEKAARLAATGTYVFQVPLNAEKVAIKKAVEGLYGVNVVAVRTVRIAGKPVNRSRHPAFRRATKKALVTIKKGQTINMYEGV